MKQEHVTMKNFCRMFDLNVETIEVAKCVGRLPAEMFSTDRHITLVDYKYAERRLEFRRKMWLQAHDLYYELMEIFESQLELSRVLSRLDCNNATSLTWNTWLSSSLFARIDDTGFILTPRAKDYKFVRFARWLLALDRKIGLVALNINTK